MCGVEIPTLEAPIMVNK
jgi:hypothetical protein